MTGDFIVSIVSIMISRLKNDDVTIILSTVGFTAPRANQIRSPASYLVYPINSI